jgi:hypothetical protein
MKIAFIVIAGLLIAFQSVDAQATACSPPATGISGALQGISSALTGIISSLPSIISSILNGLTGKLNMKVLSNSNIFYQIE